MFSHKDALLIAIFDSAIINDAENIVNKTRKNADVI
jgi:hypothetical protein